MNALISSAAGTRIALLTNDPLATAHTTGIFALGTHTGNLLGVQRQVIAQHTCCFFAATLVISETSSSTVAMSSISTSRLLPAMFACIQIGVCHGF